jgi:hypothetical protein
MPSMIWCFPQQHCDLQHFFHLHSFDLHMLGMQTDSMIAVELFY